MTALVAKPSLSFQVAYLIEALNLFVLDVPDIVRWADEEINSQSSAPYELIELALMANSNRFDAANQLLRVVKPAVSSTEYCPTF